MKTFAMRTAVAVAFAKIDSLDCSFPSESLSPYLGQTTHQSLWIIGRASVKQKLNYDRPNEKFGGPLEHNSASTDRVK
jgi:hypothetical protein